MRTGAPVSPEEAAEKGRLLFAKPCEFVLGAARLDQIPESRLPEVAFAGRSNVGKSSLVNALTGRKTLARVSNTPGRTREINFFRLDDTLMLTDLPGYGFARASKAQSDAARPRCRLLSARPNQDGQAEAQRARRDRRPRRCRVADARRRPSAHHRDVGGGRSRDSRASRRIGRFGGHMKRFPPKWLPVRRRKRDK
jgi:hypothetical protein